jgi:hypothetical protein
MISNQHYEALFLDSAPASGSYLSRSIERTLRASSCRTSILLEEEAADSVSTLVQTAARVVATLGVLPYDPAADARIEEFMATQGKSGSRRSVPRK